MKAHQFKALMLSLFAIVITSLTFVMGAPLMRVLRKSFGSIYYWSVGFLTTITLILLGSTTAALFVSTVWMTLGVYMELEQKGVTWWSAGITAVATGFVSLCGAVLVILENTSRLSWEKVQEYSNTVIQQAQTINPNLELNAEMLVAQAPSLLIILLILSLSIGLIFEKRIFTIFKLQKVRLASQIQLLEFKAPDFYIWIALFSALLVLVEFKLPFQKEIAMNVLNISAMIYFLQGLAVVEVFLKAIRAGTITRVIFYVVFVANLFLAISILGFLDFWLNFRLKIRKMILKSTSIK